MVLVPGTVVVVVVVVVVAAASCESVSKKRCSSCNSGQLSYIRDDDE